MLEEIEFKNCNYLCATSGGLGKDTILITADTRDRHWYCIVVRCICNKIKRNYIGVQNYPIFIYNL